MRAPFYKKSAREGMGGASAMVFRGENEGQTSDSDAAPKCARAQEVEGWGGGGALTLCLHPLLRGLPHFLRGGLEYFEAPVQRLVEL